MGLSMGYTMIFHEVPHGASRGPNAPMGYPMACLMVFLMACLMMNPMAKTMGYPME